MGWRRWINSTFSHFIRAVTLKELRTGEFERSESLFIFSLTMENLEADKTPEEGVRTGAALNRKVVS